MVEGRKRNSEIKTICNQYKDTLDDLTDNSNIESLNLAGSLNEISHNAFKSASSSANLSEKDCLDESFPR